MNVLSDFSPNSCRRCESQTSQVEGYGANPTGSHVQAQEGQEGQCEHAWITWLPSVIGWLAVWTTECKGLWPSLPWHPHSRTGEKWTGQADEKLVGLPGSRHSGQTLKSSWYPGTSDVPPGSVLKSTLFIICINNMDGVHHQHICGWYQIGRNKGNLSISVKEGKTVMQKTSKVWKNG